MVPEEYTLVTDCDNTSDRTACFAKQREIYETTCAPISLTTDCKTDIPGGLDTGNCYICQNIQLQNAITDGSLANSLPIGEQEDAYFTFWNEVYKTVYLSIGIVGILTCTYYIR
jgi:hypothetical protein